MTTPTATTSDTMRARLREYAQAFADHRLARMIGSKERRAAAIRLVELEEKLIGDLTANAAHGQVERTAFEIYDAVDKLGTLIEAHTSALAQASREKGPGSKP